MWRCLWFKADFLYSWSYHVPPPPPFPSPSPPSPYPLMCVHVCGGQRATFRHCPLISLFLPRGGRLSCHFWLPHCFWEILFPLSPSQLGMLALQCTSLYLALIFLMWVLEHRLSGWYGKLFYSLGHLSGPHLAFCYCCLFLLLFLTQSLTYPMMALHSQFNWGWLGIPDHIASSGGSVLAL